jgi:hypothetical protein
MNNILIFPSCTDEARQFYKKHADMAHIIASSSVSNDPLDADYPCWRHLPAINSPQFAEAFARLVADEQVGRFYTSLIHVHDAVSAIVRSLGLKVELICADPLSEAMSAIGQTMADAERMLAFVMELEPGSRISTHQAASLLFHCRRIHGESREDKLAGFMACFASAPRGDVVEIGALMGKSSFALGLLAAWHATGSVLVVDPWEGGTAVQEDLPAGLMDRSRSMNWDLIRDGFVAAMLPLAASGVNYARATSQQAHDWYVQGRTVSSPQFGVTEYLGRIGFIHIDGNHNYSEVKRDCDLWLPHVLPGGWLVLDDYTWLMGDGPRRVGDGLLILLSGRLNRAFVCGGALFLQLRS